MSFEGKQARTVSDNFRLLNLSPDVTGMDPQFCPAAFFQHGARASFHSNFPGPFLLAARFHLGSQLRIGNSGQICWVDRLQLLLVPAWGRLRPRVLPGQRWAGPSQQTLRRGQVCWPRPPQSPVRHVSALHSPNRPRSCSARGRVTPVRPSPKWHGGGCQHPTKVATRRQRQEIGPNVVSKGGNNKIIRW